MRAASLLPAPALAHDLHSTSIRVKQMTIDANSSHSDPTLSFGPAVSRPGRMPPQVGGAADAPIPPFSPTSMQPVAPAARTPGAAEGASSPPGAGAVDAPVDAAEAGVDLTWLDGIDWGDEAMAEPRAAGGDANDAPTPVTEPEPADRVVDETVPAWISWAEEEGKGEAEVHEVSALVEDYGELHRGVAGQPVDSAGSVPESLDAPAVGAAGAVAHGLGEDVSSAALHEVADRLESIAASLRTKTIADLLEETPRADPLELLITSFVLGGATRVRTSAER